MRIDRYSDDTMVEDDETITYQIDTGSDDSNNEKKWKSKSTYLVMPTKASQNILTRL